MPIYPKAKEYKMPKLQTKEVKTDVIETKSDDIESLREEYEIITGEKPDGRWKIDRLKSELENHA